MSVNIPNAISFSGDSWNMNAQVIDLTVAANTPLGIVPSSGDYRYDINAAQWVPMPVRLFVAQSLIIGPMGLALFSGITAAAIIKLTSTNGDLTLPFTVPTAIANKWWPIPFVANAVPNLVPGNTVNLTVITPGVASVAYKIYCLLWGKYT